jgi:hypothetical protein
MDYRKFDLLTRRLSVAGSRRQALRAVLGAALVGTAAGEVAAKPKKKEIKPGKECLPGVPPEADTCAKYPVPAGSGPEHCCHNGSCSCGGRCNCKKTCFVNTVTNDAVCCKGREGKICVSAGTETCCGPKLDCKSCEGSQESGIPGRYRRR